MQWLRRSLLTAVALTIAVSVSGDPRHARNEQKPRQRDTHERQGTSSPWTRLIQKILDDVIPPSPDNRGSIPPG